jgi:signal transduction histidine kinase
MLLDSLIPLKMRKTRRVLALRQLMWNRIMARLTDQPLWLLLKIEWLLLATAIFMEVLLPFQPSWFVLGRVMAIGLFGLLGLRLPKGTLRPKLLYTAVEFGLILLAAIPDSLSNDASIRSSIFLLCLVLVMRSCLLFAHWGQLTVLSLALFTYSTLLFSKSLRSGKDIVWDWRSSNILLFGLTLIFALLLINALLSERQSRAELEMAHQQLEATHAQLRQYALRIEDQATLQERNRISREIHDGLGHILAAQTIQINNALLFWQSDSEQAVTFLKQAKQLGAEAFLEVRKSVSMLRSNPLQGQSLEVALKKLLADFQHTTGLEVFSDIQLSSALPTELSIALFRITQESLTNIAKHAQATTVTVQLQQTGMINLSIQDNGSGFNPNQNTTGFGLQGMRERATALGGQFIVQSQPGTGCSISVSLPRSQL